MKLEAEYQKQQICLSSKSSNTICKIAKQIVKPQKKEELVRENK
jgi:hypothetical protein